MESGPEIIGFGCRLNAFESEVMRDLAGRADDLVIVHTCAVTGEAVRQARQAIRSARRRRPDARIVVTGCAAQIDPMLFAEMPEVDRVLGNGEKLRPESWHRQANERVEVGDVGLLRETAGHLIAGFAERSRAFVQVQNGCDHRCTFCIIPYGRGPSRSVPVAQVADQVRTLHANGVKEVVLCGVDLTSYGADLPGTPSLGALVRETLAAEPALPRLRLSSLDPAEIDEELWRLIAEEPRLMPHLHLSIQSGDDVILKRMKRRHARADVLAVAERARGLRPDVALGADLIAGFPTETEAMFESTLRLVEECGLVYLHVFPYSPRAGTPAARMPQLPAQERKQRAARLRAEGERSLASFLATKVGAPAELLIESRGSGRTRDFALVEGAGGEPGELRTVAPRAVDGDRLVA